MPGAVAYIVPAFPKLSEWSMMTTETARQRKISNPISRETVPCAEGMSFIGISEAQHGLFLTPL
jgi:hypothetical protein